MNDERGASPAFYRVVHKLMWVRDAPSTSAGKLGTLKSGQIVGVVHTLAGTDGTLWAELADEERAFFNEKRPGFALVDGAALGLPALLRAIPAGDAEEPPLALWRLPHELHAVTHGGLPPQRTGRYAKPDGEWPHATSSDDYLCYWRAVDERRSAGAVGWHGRVASAELRAAISEQWDEAGPVLATCTLLRGAPPRSVENFCLYHRAVGFSQIYLYFDAPHEPNEAV